MNLVNPAAVDLGGRMGVLRGLNPLEIFSTPSSVITVALLGAIGSHFWNQAVEAATEARAELDFANKILKKYDEMLGIYGCMYDASNPTVTERNMDACFLKINTIQKERDTGNAIANQINIEGSLAVSLGDDRISAVAKIARFFANSQNGIEDLKVERNELRSFIHEGNSNIKVLSQQAKEYNDDSKQAQALLRSCENDKNAYFKMYEKENEAKANCLDMYNECEIKSKDNQDKRDYYAAKYEERKKWK